MSCPIIPLAAEVLWVPLNEPTHMHYFHYWHHFVDDVFCLWMGTLSQLQTFLNHIDSLFTLIAFTVSIKGPQHNFAIYRKLIFSDVTIHSSPFCSPACEYVAYHYYIDRLISLPLSKPNFNKKVEVIKYSDRINGINLNINEIIQKQLGARASHETILSSSKKKPPTDRIK